ncbi:SEC-C domain-containing protein [Candidatus Saccharibacteria bacterium]|nr:SEC-C domain-containing protein [Candidatus Saccharibacteria bacterium]
MQPPRTKKPLERSQTVQKIGRNDPCTCGSGKGQGRSA